MIKGKQSIAFKESPYIEESASVVGKKEGEGPLGSRFDMVGLDDMFGEDTWEKAESSMQKEACQLALGKAHLTAGAIRYLFGGDLLRQGVATSLELNSCRYRCLVCTVHVQRQGKHSPWHRCVWRQDTESGCS